MSTTKTIPPKTKTFQFKDVTHQITFPNNRQYVNIQNLKASLCSNLDIVSRVNADGSYAEALVNVEAHLTILCPSLLKTFAKPMGELSMIEGVEIVQFYNKEIDPWYNEVLNFVFGVNKEETETEATTETTTQSE